MDFLENIGVIIGVSVGIISGIIYIYKSAKSTAKGVDEETIKTYEDNYKALSRRIEILEIENKKLHADINQLIGENRALKETLSLRDPQFVKEMTRGFRCMSEMLTALKAHDVQAAEIKQTTEDISIDIKAVRSFCDDKASPVLDQIHREHDYKSTKIKKKGDYVSIKE
jgi:glutamate synthase domain-containing protein 3